jgi:endonuclease G
MKKHLISAALILSIPLSVWANPIDDKCPQFAAYGAPVAKEAGTQYQCKTNYAFLYNNTTKTAEYVLEHVTKANTSGPAKRKDNFRPDDKLAAGTSATLADYASAGNIYDRGHMAPAGDNTTNDQIMSESFFLSNMVPQVANNNRGIWKQLETAVRDYVVKFGDVYVASGPIYDAGYKTIGAGKVGVPTRLYKIIIDPRTLKASAYIFPNTALPVADLPKYKTTIAEVEKATGINFNPKLPAGQAALENAKTW